MADAHEIWAAAQLAPGEWIEDGVARIEALLALPSPAGEPEMPANAAYWWSPKDGAMAGTWSSNTGPHPDWDVTHYFTADQLRAYGDARAEHARQEADMLMGIVGDCREAFPAPAPGDPLENSWACAIARPEEVPAYLREIAARYAAAPPQGEQT